MGPTWVLSAPDGPHVGPMNLTIRVLLGFWSSNYSERKTEHTNVCTIRTIIPRIVYNENNSCHMCPFTPARNENTNSRIITSIPVPFWCRIPHSTTTAKGQVTEPSNTDVVVMAPLNKRKSHASKWILIYICIIYIKLRIIFCILLHSSTVALLVTNSMNQRMWSEQLSHYRLCKKSATLTPRRRCFRAVSSDFFHEHICVIIQPRPFGRNTLVHHQRKRFHVIRRL